MTKIFRWIRPYIPHIIIAIVFICLETYATLSLPSLMADIINKGVSEGNTEYIYKSGRVMLLVAGIGLICSVVTGFLSSKISAGFGKILRYKVFSKVISFESSEFDKFNTSSLITRTINDITQIQSTTVLILRVVIIAPIMCIGGITMLLYKGIPLVWILYFSVPIIILAVFVIGKIGFHYFELIPEKIDELTLALRERLAGTRVIRAFNQEKHIEKKFDVINNDIKETYRSANLVIAFLTPILILIINLTTLAIVWFGAPLIENHLIELGSLMAFIEYSMQILYSFITVASMFIMLPRAVVAIKRVNEVLDTDSETENLTEIIYKNKKDKISSIKFENVCFSYQSSEKTILKNINFTAKSGEVTAIIGGMGSGKSTLVNLIPRFFEIDKGNIYLNDTNIKNISKEELRSKIGLVLQKPVLFSGTINDNVKLGNKDIDQTQIENALKVSQSLEFVSDMEDKLESKITQGGNNLSVGQKQRLSIARALARNPEIYIFDDSFSALDYKTYSKLKSALQKEVADAIVFITSQRVKTIMNADHIIVLDKGEIVGIGTHKELIKNCQIYIELVSSQFQSGEMS